MKFKNLKLLSAFLVGHPTAVADEPLLEVFGEVLTLNHEIKQAPRRSLPSLKEGADLDEEENLHDLQGYYLHSTITFRIGLVNGETDENSELTLRVWDPAWRKFPGWNPPFVEIFKNGKRVSGQLLKEVGMV
ncbi:MAG: hypothetical protein Q7Q71_06420, partial [Verrucomicrobiota bacterium JB023]|nr:hypothetical protein [Verrucomicrobiota bacterium JB023]